MPSHALGKFGESLARDYLLEHGYIILHNNWRYSRYGEIDIIAYAHEKHLLAFVEVKTRKNDSYGHPLEAVTLKQQNTIRMLAEMYLATYHPTTTYPFDHISFDLITIMPSNNKFDPPTIQHVESAF